MSRRGSLARRQLQVTVPNQLMGRITGAAVLLRKLASAVVAPGVVALMVVCDAQTALISVGLAMAGTALVLWLPLRKIDASVADAERTGGPVGE